MLARRFDAELCLRYVSQVPDGHLGDATYLGDQFMDADLKEGRKQMNAVVGQLERHDVRHCGGEVTFGLAAKVTLARASAEKHDLLVLGTPGRSGLRRLWRGSFADRVVAHAAIPVLTIRPHKPLDAQTGGDELPSRAAYQ